MAILEKLLRKVGFSLLHSQEGEDLVLGRLLASRPSGFYLDIGGHHPWRYSNTAMLYARGWEGVVLEPNPRMAPWFRLLRPRDRFVRCAAGGERSSARYRMFRESALNTMDPDLAAERVSKGFRASCEVEVEIRTVDEVLESLRIERAIDLVSIDVEGFESRVLQGFDVSRWKPEVVCIERIGVRIGQEGADPVLHDLMENGYTPFSKLLHSWILVRGDSELLHDDVR